MSLAWNRSSKLIARLLPNHPYKLDRINAKILVEGFWIQEDLHAKDIDGREVEGIKNQSLRAAF